LPSALGGKLATDVTEHLTQIVPDLAFGRGVAQQVSGVKSRHDRDAPFVQSKSSAEARDALGEPQESRHRRPPQGYDDAWLEEFELTLEKRRARLHLDGRWTSIVGRTAFDHVAHVDFLA